MSATGEEAFRAGQDTRPINDVQDKKDGTSDDGSTTNEDSTQSACSKRSHSPSHDKSSKRLRVSKSASARALSEMSDAIRSMVEYIREPEPAAQTIVQMSSPARQRAIVREAIKRLEEDNDLSEDDQVTAIDLFTTRPSVADSFIAISRQSLRTRFVQRQIDNYKYHDEM